MDDLISRQAAIEAIERNAYRHTYLDQILDIIKSMPSAQPERKKGKWEAVLFHISDDGNELYEHYCSICKKAVMITNLKTGRFPFCPNCGARMEASDD